VTARVLTEHINLSDAFLQKHNCANTQQQTKSGALQVCLVRALLPLTPVTSGVTNTKHSSYSKREKTQRPFLLDSRWVPN
jgi:hypothetical protein